MQADYLSFNNLYDTVKYIIPIMTLNIPNIICEVPRAVIHDRMNLLLIMPKIDAYKRSEAWYTKSEILHILVSITIIANTFCLLEFEFKIVKDVAPPILAIIFS